MATDGSRDSSGQHYPRVVLLGVGGIVFGVLLCSLQPGPVVGKRFIDLPEFQIWRLLIAAQTCLFFAIFLPVLKRVRRVKSQAHCRWMDWRVWGPAVGLMALFISLPLVAPSFDLPLPHHRLRLLTVVLMAGIVAMLSAIGFALIAQSYPALVARAQACDASSDRKTRVEITREYVALGADARWLLTTLGTMVALGTLASGALGNALAALVASISPGTPPPLPPALIIAYGTCLTLLLAVAYVPLHAVGVAAGSTLRSILVPVDPGPDGRDVDLEAQLKLAGSARDVMESSAVILSPLVAALFTELVAKG